MIVLASGSPRRAEILGSLGIRFEVNPADVDEAPLPGESPGDHTRRLAETKALAVARVRPEVWVLAGDTVVSVGGRIFGKPAHREDAVSMLLDLQGREHVVSSALALVVPRQDGTIPRALVESETTTVTFRAFDRATADAYVSAGEPMDKAGAYGIQGKGAALVERVDGDYSCVVGLPVPALMRLFERVGHPYRFDDPSPVDEGPFRPVRGTKG